ncbi:TonB-dependent receptor plug domain-containing protein [Microbaculum marinisediminis]|uniref:TonB-dependent receptor n=1 Tax=Microbaculum marinisediminis TaxID=2931392 RepID=A0AAW5R1W3_9HYPH|nr:TonB-dependent receptor [Microbaculum sp. A6E488]MCT8974265.1 TonB-dependent receptor [Microbaculum sp. A6E488]
MPKSVLTGSSEPRLHSVSVVILIAALALAPAPRASAQDVRSADDETASDGRFAPVSEAAAVTLDEITVSPNRTATPDRAVGSTVTVITGEELEEQQIRVVSDVLRQVPGVAVNRTGGIGDFTQVRIRGAEGNQTMVRIDGIEMNDPAFGSEFDFGNLLVQDVARIEVLRGPQSALYGSDAIGGVINIVTRRGDGAPSATVSAEGGSFGTFRGHASVSASDDRFDLLVSAVGLSTDGISSADEANGNLEKDAYRNGTGLIKFGIHPTEDIDLAFVGRFTNFMREGDADIGGIGPIDAFNDSRGEQLFGRVQGTFRMFEGRWEHIFGATRTDQTTDYLADKAVTSTYRGDKNKLDYQSNLYLEQETVPASHTLTFLAEHETQGVKVDSLWSNLDRTIESTGLVGQYQLGLFDSLFVTAAVRHDVNDLFEDADTYRLTGAYTIDATGTKLRASYGTGVKNPTMFELYGYTQTYRGNPNLKPEQAAGWDVGIDQALWGERVVADATYFDMRITDLITGAGTTSVNMPGESRIHGVELGVSVSPLDNLFVRASYTYTDGKDATGADLVRRPPHLASLDVNYVFLDGRANANLSVVYNGAQKDWVYDAVYNRSVLTLDAYTLVNVAGSYKLSDTAELFGRVDNLFDEQYQEVWGYGTPGRAAYAGLRLAF